jgi:hypothetical protein
MLEETKNGGAVGVTPESLFKILRPQEYKGVVVLALKDIGEVNEFYASTITIEQLIVLHAQLGAHINTLLGPMKEGF